MWGLSKALTRRGLLVGLGSVAALGLGGEQLSRCADASNPDAERVTYWKTKWDEYTASNVTPGFHKSTPNELLMKNVDKICPADKKSSVFVPLCGKTLDLIFLSSFGDVSGIECAEQAIEQFSAENNLPYNRQVLEKSQGTLHVATEPSKGNKITIGKLDFFDLPAKWDGVHEKFSAGYDRAANVAIHPSLREKYAKVMADQIMPGGKVLLIVFEYDQAKMSGPPFSILEDDVRKHYEPYFDVQLVSRDNALEQKGPWKSKLDSLFETTYILTRK